MVKKLKITQTRSTIGKSYKQRRTIKALGLRRIRHTVIHNDTPSIRGMINKVSHLVKVEEIEEKEKEETIESENNEEKQQEEIQEEQNNDKEIKEED